jgi:DNA helicase-2/ATP-dependent DNA helicase PcrA
MPIPPPSLAPAQSAQDNAAHDGAAITRLIAGPGTGKSTCIEKRACWLLQQSVIPAGIFAVSFTRASTKDLRDRIRAHCNVMGQAGANGIRVSTVHALALRTLRRAGLLTHYPVDPLVLDDWELTNIFDAEFGARTNITSKVRRENIRRYHEAFWSTGSYNAANYLPPDPPISQTEASAFSAFHGPTTQVYSCVVPGEIVRQCVRHMQAGTIDPVALLNIQHLIVDEFQDLNPMDLNFIYGIIDRGVPSFIAGDDDQSIYSFRFAMPSGIQQLPTRYPATSSHTLDECFRCMPTIVSAANTLISAHSTSQRVPKTLKSLYRHNAPAVAGIVHRWAFNNAVLEAKAIAESCAALIAAGLSPDSVLILINNQRVLVPDLLAVLYEANVPVDIGVDERFSETNVGKLVHAILRVVVNPDDYVAHRIILGVRRGVGVSTTNRIRQSVVDNNLNFRDIFYHPLPQNVFTARAVSALNAARDVCGVISQWQDSEELHHRAPEIQTFIDSALGGAVAAAWQTFVSALPVGITIKEAHDYMGSESRDDEVALLQTIYERLGQTMPAEQVLPARVKVMTMHGAKGLSARVVFIPGAEDELVPGPWRNPYPGLVLEAARLLYVSVTRARAALVISYARRRLMHGHMDTHTPSRFTANLGGAFSSRVNGLSPQEAQQITTECAET